MWEELGLNITSLESRPTRAGCIAAAFRQLLRAHEADDTVAAWQATGSFCMCLRLLLKDLLSREASWDSKGRWLEGFAENRVLFLRPRQVRVRDAIVWGLRADVGGPQGAEPFDAELELRPDLSDLASYTIRAVDMRSFPGEDLQSGLSRIKADAASGKIVWRYAWSKMDTCEAGAGVGP
jgi:hypothetical protein